MTPTEQPRGHREKPLHDLGIAAVPFLRVSNGRELSVASSERNFNKHPTAWRYFIPIADQAVLSLTYEGVMEMRNAWDQVANAVEHLHVEGIQAQADHVEDVAQDQGLA